MKKIFAIGMLAAMSISFVPAHAESTTGTILVPTGTVSRIERCNQEFQAAPEGTFGVALGVTPGADFTLTATDGTSDFDIAFHKSLAPCAEGSDAVDPAGDHTTVIGDEAGTVPPDATVAIINLVVGAPGAEFTYSE